MDDLLKMVTERSYLQVAKDLGISDNAIRQHIRRRNISVPKKHKPKDQQNENTLDSIP
jgi:hypothetical protein